MRAIILTTATMLAALPAGAQTAPVPACDSRYRDQCQQTAATERKAITAEQAADRDARHNGEWSPNHLRKAPQKDEPKRD
jgi:uncharacterized membrane protein YgcG